MSEMSSQVRRTPSFSGPLMLPNRASANSLSAPIKFSGGNVDIQFSLKIIANATGATTMITGLQSLQH